jgi:hypothetical protein
MLRPRRNPMKRTTDLSYAEQRNFQLARAPKVAAASNNAPADEYAANVLPVTRPLAFAPPIFLSLTLHRRRRRVLYLQPIIEAAGAIRRAEPLRHNALAAKRASLLEDVCTVVIVVIIEADAVTLPEERISQHILAFFDRRPAQVPAVKLD